VCPSGHGLVSDAPNDDGRWPNGEGASKAGDCHVGERHRERGHVVRPAMGEGQGVVP
jgi:hypothetical protein